ncbi:MAG: hypothetical protein IJY98_05830 [Bacteroidaceae bacterium]|nr:hypothetical protein [Bacteroidaceae bacterium]
MLKGLLAKYEPINTVAKVDALIADMQASNISITSSVSLEVLLHIKKAKIQMYFRETIQPFLNTKPKVSPIINASTNRVTFNGNFNIEFVYSDNTYSDRPKVASKKEPKVAQTPNHSSAPVSSKRKKVAEIPVFVESFKLFEGQTDIEKFIKAHKSNITTSLIDGWLKYVDDYIKHVKLKIYFRKRMFDLMEEIRSKSSGSPCTKMRMEQEKRNEEANRYVPMHIISIPMGGKNKKY